jgi:hypothetical protein
MRTLYTERVALISEPDRRRFFAHEGFVLVGDGDGLGDARLEGGDVRRGRGAFVADALDRRDLSGSDARRDAQRLLGLLVGEDIVDRDGLVVLRDHALRERER